MDWRKKRQLIYGGVFFSLIFLIFIFYFLNQPPEPPTCFDGKKNQDEEDVDCGGSCPPCELKVSEPIKVYKSYFLPFSKKIDLIGIVQNPNDNLAVKNLNYFFEIYDLNNFLIATTSLKKTILEPNQKRYLVESITFDSDVMIGYVKLKVSSVKDEDWEKLKLDKVKLSIYNQKVFKENNKWKISFTVFNPDFIPYSDLELIILFYNNNVLIGVIKSIISLKAQELKDFILTLSETNFEPTGVEFFVQRTNLER